MTRPSDETLMAYADDALPPKEQAAVEAHLAHDAEDRDLVARLRKSRDLLGAAFEAPMHEPVPQALVDMILAAPEPKAQVIPFPRRVLRAMGETVGRRALPIAASIALVIGAAVGYTAGRHSGALTEVAIRLGPAPAGSALASALETAVSGDAVPARGAAGAEALTVVATFRDRGQRPCREFEHVGPQPRRVPIAVGVACRSKEGGWTVLGAAQLATPAASGDGYQPSGAEEADALRGLMTVLGVGRALAPAEEQALITSRWR